MTPALFLCLVAAAATSTGLAREIPFVGPLGAASADPGAPASGVPLNRRATQNDDPVPVATRRFQRPSYLPSSLERSAPSSGGAGGMGALMRFKAVEESEHRASYLPGSTLGKGATGKAPGSAPSGRPPQKGPSGPDDTDYSRSRSAPSGANPIPPKPTPKPVPTPVPVTIAKDLLPQKTIADQPSAYPSKPPYVNPETFPEVKGKVYGNPPASGLRRRRRR